MTRPRRTLFRFAAAAAAALTAACMTPNRPPPAPAPPPETPHAAVIRIAAGIRQAAYEDDRERLAALFTEMEPYTEGELGSRARYWRGFALWRRAFNESNDPTPEGETGVEEDLKGAVREFQESSSLDPRFVDARIAELACLALLAPTIPASQRPQEYRRQWKLLLEAQEQAPHNPRLAWVLGAAMWTTPVKQGGGPDKAFQLYKDGLDSARKQTITDAADPAWGEAELLMSLARARLDGASRNLDAADHYAHAALNVVPNWRYVRDVLLPQIQAAKDSPPPAKPGAKP